MASVPGASIEVEGLGHRYVSRSDAVTVLDGLDLAIDAGSHVALTGASGSGKSTLLCVLGGLEAPQRGTVRVGGHDLRHTFYLVRLRLILRLTPWPPR